jgi:hypothetical protein
LSEALLEEATQAGPPQFTWGTAELSHGAVIVEPARKLGNRPMVGRRSLILFGCQESRGEVGGLYISDRTTYTFTLCSTSERDQSLVGWLIIG